MKAWVLALGVHKIVVGVVIAVLLVIGTLAMVEIVRMYRPKPDDSDDAGC